MAEPWHRTAVGGLWDELGALQLDFLVQQGLTPSMSVLDIGCGSLRGGAHLIRYLNARGYVGVDKDAELLEAGRRHELGRALELRKRPKLVEMADFDFRRLDRRFDVALAQSVFTHLDGNTILRCLVRVRDALAPRGSLYATYFECGADPLEPVRQHPEVVTTIDSDPFHYPRSFFAWAAGEAGLALDVIGEWGHPRNQRMLRFRALG